MDTVARETPNNESESCAGKTDSCEGPELLTLLETSQRIKFARQTLYNMISTGVFIKNVHYLKPTPKKVLFIWPAIVAWLRQGDRKAEKAGANRIRI